MGGPEEDADRTVLPGGLIAVAALILTLSDGISPENLTVTAASSLFLTFTKIPPPLIVLAAFGLGIIA